MGKKGGGGQKSSGGVPVAGLVLAAAAVLLAVAGAVLWTRGEGGGAGDARVLFDTPGASPSSYPDVVGKVAKIAACFLFSSFSLGALQASSDSFFRQRLILGEECRLFLR